MMATACAGSGTICSTRVFILCAGIRQTGATPFRGSNSRHAAPMTSLGRQAVSASRRRASFVGG